jgi:threonine dehydrogenase-like Zn-dependent dehydrogenase
MADADQMMKALVFRGPRNIALESVLIPEIEELTDCIVKITLCSVCGSDMHPYHAREVGIDHGTICGHEFVGTVHKMGSSITTFTIGQRVMSPFTCSCANCFYCCRGLTARCEHSQVFGWKENNKGLHGAQAQFIRIPLAESTLLPLPDPISDEIGLLLGDILSTGYFCAENAEINHSTDVVAVVGCGPVGLLAVAAARYLGAKTVIALDAIPDRLAVAQKIYHALPINISTTADVVKEVQNLTQGRGADCVLELVGLPAAFKLACDLVRPGGIVSVAGCHAEAVAPMQLVYNKNLTIKSGRCSARYFMDKLLPLLLLQAKGCSSESGNGNESGENSFIDLTPIITHRLPLNPEAYTVFDSKKDGVIKVVMNPWL